MKIPSITKVSIGDRNPNVWLGLFCVGLIVGVILSDGSAQAQDDTRLVESEPEKKTEDSVTLRKQASVAVEAIEESSREISQQLQTARRDRDVVRVLCLGDKLSQVNVALRSAKNRQEAMLVALKRKDVDRAQHESLVLGVLAGRVRALVGESTQCVGEETGFIGEAEVTVSIDPNLPDDVSGDGSLSSYPSLAPPSIGSAID